MTYTFKMPDIGEGVVEAEIVAWHVKVGDEVAEDDPIADAMTDKATIELTAPVDGTVTSIGCEAGDKLAVGSALVVFATDGEVEEEEEAESVSPAPEPGLREERRKVEGTAERDPGSGQGTRKISDSGQVLASPKVRAAARERGIDLASVTGSGAGGRVTLRDLDSKPATPAPSGIVIPMPAIVDGESRTKVIGLRRLIAERMQDSKRAIPHFTYVEEIDVTELEA